MDKRENFGLPGVAPDVREIWGQKAGVIADQLTQIFGKTQGMTKEEMSERLEILGIVGKMLGAEKVEKIKSALDGDSINDVLI